MQIDFAQMGIQIKGVSPEVMIQKLKKIRMVLLDVDGVLSDGVIWMSAEGEMVKPFHVHDGLGIRLLQKKQIQVGIITGRSSKALTRRLEDLQINIVYQDIGDKDVAYQKILAQMQLQNEEVAYMGDDLPDLPVLQRVGISAAPVDAVEEVLNVAQFIAPYTGGHGAVRSLADCILKSKNSLG